MECSWSKKTVILSNDGVKVAGKFFSQKDIFDIFYERKTTKKIWVVDVDRLDSSRADHYYLVSPEELVQRETPFFDAPKEAAEDLSGQVEKWSEGKGLTSFGDGKVILRWVESEKDCRREIFASQMPAEIIQDNELMQNFKKFEEFVKKQHECEGESSDSEYD